MTTMMPVVVHHRADDHERSETREPRTATCPRAYYLSARIAIMRRRRGPIIVRTRPIYSSGLVDGLIIIVLPLGRTRHPIVVEHGAPKPRVLHAGRDEDAHVPNLRTERMELVNP